METRLQFITMDGRQQNKDGFLTQHMTTKMRLVYLILSFSSLILGRYFGGEQGQEKKSQDNGSQITSLHYLVTTKETSGRDQDLYSSGIFSVFIGRDQNMYLVATKEDSHGSVHFWVGQLAFKSRGKPQTKRMLVLDLIRPRSSTHIFILHLPSSLTLSQDFFTSTLHLSTVSSWHHT